MAPQESLLKVYGDRSYRHVTMARHQGTTIAFAMDSARRIVYSVLDLAGQRSKGDADAAYWSDNPAELILPRELAEVGFAVVGAAAMPTVKRGGAEAGVDERPLDSEIDPYLSTTARLTADAPFHVVSDGTYVVVLRQSIGETHPDAVYKLTGGGCSASASRTDYVLSGSKKVPLVRDTLLCDRFLLVDGKLRPVLEVRYKRSRHATPSRLGQGHPGYRGHGRSTVLRADSGAVVRPQSDPGPVRRGAGAYLGQQCVALAVVRSQWRHRKDRQLQRRAGRAGAVQHPGHAFLHQP